MGSSENEARLSLECERLGRAMATWGIGVFDHDHRSGELYATARFRELYGMGLDDELSVQTLGMALFPPDMPSAMRAVQKAHDPTGDGHFDLLHRIIRKDGAVRWIHSRSETSFEVIDGKHAPVRTLGSIVDMTEHHELELALERQRTRLEEATAATAVGIVEIDHRPSYDEEGVYVSSTFIEVTQLQGKRSPDFSDYIARVPKRDRQRVQQGIAGLFDPEGPGRVEIEHRYELPDGSLRWLLFRARTTFEEGGPKREPLLTVGTILDVTPSQKAREELEERSAILDATPDFVCIADKEGTIKYLNQAGRRFLGIPEDESVEKHRMDAVHLGATLQQILKEALPSAREHGSWRGESTFVDKAGTEVPMSQIIVSHPGDDEHGPRYSTIARSLAREKELEEKFRHSQKMEAVGQLAGGIAHDFNNLLSVIFGFSEMGLDVLESEHAARESFDEIRVAAERASALTRQLLAFSRKQILSPRVIDVNDLLRRALPMLQRVINESIQLSVVFSQTPVRIKADLHQIEQILLNLVVNARDAMPNGGCLVIETGTQEVEEETLLGRTELPYGDYVVIAVTDNGQGMDAETREHIFEPFFTTKEQGKGTGLGLSTVFGIVNQSGGGIYVYSEPGRGTTFKIYLPSTVENETRVVKERRIEPKIEQATVLLAEDDAQVRKMVIAVLRKAGLTVLEASGPVEALGLAQAYEREIDLLVTDVVMPQLTGGQLAEKLAESRPRLRVLYMSGYTEDSVIHHGVLDGGIHFLPKPIHAQALLEAVDQVLAGRWSPSGE